MPRLYHHKSRTGCARCRARRVKCNEARPRCAGCTKHDMECVYDRQANGPSRSITNSSEATSRPSNDPASPLDEDWPESRERRLLELRLLHIFTVHVCPTLPACDEPRGLKAWSIDVPRLAMKYEPLLMSILSVSLLFVAASPEQELPYSTEQLRLARARYFEATIKEHRQDVGTLDEETVDAVASAAILIMFDSFARLRERRPQRGHGYKPPTEWLQLSLGMRAVIGMGIRLNADQSDGVIKQLMDASSEFWMEKYILNEANQARFSHLLEPYKNDMILGDDEEKMYSRALAYLGSIANGMEAGDSPLKTARRITINHWLQSNEFVDKLNKFEPRAMVVLAHYFALATSSSWLWWIGDSPLKELEALVAYMGSDWQEMMAWPSQVLRERRAAYLLSTMI